MDLINILHALANEVRVKMVYLLCRGKFSQKHFEDTLEINQSTASRNLKKLKDANIIEENVMFSKKRYSVTSDFISKYPDLYNNIFSLFEGTTLKEISNKYANNNGEIQVLI